MLLFPHRHLKPLRERKTPETVLGDVHYDVTASVHWVTEFLL